MNPQQSCVIICRMTETSPLKSTTIVKSVARYFYAAILDNFDAKSSILEKYMTGGGDIDIQKMIDVAKSDEAAREKILKFVPADLLDANQETLDAVNEAFRDIYEKSLKGGYVRAALEVLYDSKFQSEFNKMTDGWLSKVQERVENLPFNPVLAFLNAVGGSTLHPSDYSAVTPRKAAKEGNKEKVNNPYTAYKVYAQGTYSKLLICHKAAGLLAPEDRNNLDKLLAKFLDVIFNEKEIRYYTTRDGDTVEIVPRESIQNFVNSDIDENKEKLYDDWMRNSYILQYQEEAIDRILQRFNDYVPYELDSEIKKIRSDDKISIRKKIANECRIIYFSWKKKNNLDKLGTYASGSMLDSNEKDFIRRYFNSVADWLDSLDDDMRDIFNEQTDCRFFTRKKSLKEKKESLEWLVGSNQIPDDMPEDIREKLEKLPRNTVWQGIINKYNGETQQQNDILRNNIENPVHSHKDAYGSETRKEELIHGYFNRLHQRRKELDDSFITEFDRQTKRLFTSMEESLNIKQEALDLLVHDKAACSYLPEDMRILIESYEKEKAELYAISKTLVLPDALTQPRQNLLSNLSEPAHCLFSLIDKDFYEAPSFCSGVYNLISGFDSNTSGPRLRGTKLSKALKDSMHALLPSNKAKKDFDAYLNEKENTCPDTNIPWKELAEKFLPKPKDNDQEGSINRLKMLYAIAMLDKEHSWEGSFNWYKRELDESSDIELEKQMFRKKMGSINDRFRQKMGC
ncbi:MAG: hypothetical protein ILP18_05660 [Treponema sp.]|nr:hypothetical protein [Treponema sp.]